ncbi:MAG: F0F1 ATP synthase subunit beta, partial [Gemmatimonadota bacterium]
MVQGNGSAMGRVVQVIGPVIDVEFANDAIPEIYNALEIKQAGTDGSPDIRVVAEVQQHIGRSQVR